MAKVAQELTINDEAMLRPGDLFADRYRIQRHLGHGDRKHTYLAEDIKVKDRLVALSIVRPEAALLDREGTEREAHMLARIGSHPNIVALIDVGVEDATEYIVFEYLGGGSLDDLIRRTAEEGISMPLEKNLVIWSPTRSCSFMHSQCGHSSSRSIST